jgi:hypothetical protein
VTVEIKMGSRQVLLYLLSPLLRYRQEALRERQVGGDPVSLPLPICQD